jgi:HEAT repeat protein
MGPFIQRRIASWPKVCLLAGICAAALVPSISRGADPVEQIREALKIQISPLDPKLELAAKRDRLIKSAILDLKTISQLRRAYFLKQWAHHLKPEKAEKGPDLDPFRVEIGAKLTTAIRSAAKDTNVDRQLALAILIAEIADSESPLDQDVREKFARGFTDVAQTLAEEKDLPTRQAALYALGKITPEPGKALPTLKQALEKDELGPRRLAAYALVNLARNARFLKRSEKLDTIEGVLVAAAGDLNGAFALRDPDEPVRGYCLLAILESGKIIADHFSASEDLRRAEKKTIDADLQKALRTFQGINPHLLSALQDSKLNVRLSALQALDQISSARGKILQSLQEIGTEKRETNRELMKTFGVPDPLGPIIERDWKVIASLLKDGDVRLRRGAIDFLEQLGDQAEPAIEEITEALRDPDRGVRLAAAHTMGSMPPQKVNAGAIRTLGTMLIDPDPDLSRAAADAIDAFGPAAQDAVDWLAFVIGNGDTDNRNWDAENRNAAMKALVSIGVASAQRAIPKVVAALDDSDVRVRRAAADTLGALGRPNDAALAQQAVAALRRALNDEDAEVRLSASEAMLTMLAPRKGV